MSDRPTDSTAGSEAARGGPPSRAEGESARSAYWRRNLRYLVVLLAIWAAVSFGCGVLFADELNRFRLFGSGYKLGFWFAQQGSIYVFVLLILVYVWLMNRLDAAHGVGEDEGKH